MNDIFVLALKNKFRMEQEDAVELANTVESVFKGKEEVEDMTIDKYIRALFFELEREKLLKLRREEYKEKGRIIRKFYWSFNTQGIHEVACEKVTEDEYKIYKNIPKEAWLARACCN